MMIDKLVTRVINHKHVICGQATAEFAGRWVGALMNRQGWHVL
jgi:hypothetical protein|tara:strand:- start:798 stop:926 length:129 start_codon:yes stop_codon:yes gene_type:complete